jgi:hypothetical protein
MILFLLLTLARTLGKLCGIPTTQLRHHPGRAEQAAREPAPEKCVNETDVFAGQTWPVLNRPDIQRKAGRT